MFMRSRNRLSLAISVVVLSCLSANADDRSPVYQLPSGLAAAPALSPTGAETAGHDGPRRSAFSRLGRFIDRHPASRRTIVGLGGPLGVVVDYSQGLPRVRGLSLMPSDAVTLEASGRIGTGFDDVSGQLSLHLSF